MTRRVLSVVALLTLALGLPISAARADPIRITGGSLEFPEHPEVSLLSAFCRSSETAASRSTDSWTPAKYLSGRCAAAVRALAP